MLCKLHAQLIPQVGSLVAASRRDAHGDGHPVPYIDPYNGPRQFHRLLLVEVGTYLLVEMIRGLALRQQGQRFSPGEGSPLAQREDIARFAPDSYQVDALVCQSRLASFRDMDRQA